MADSNIQTLDTVKPITLDEYQERTAHLQENTTSLLSTIADRQVQAAGLATQAASLASEVNAVAEQASLSFSKKTWTDTATSGTPITAADLNRLENAISSLTTAVNNLQDSVSQNDDWYVVKVGNGATMLFTSKNIAVINLEKREYVYKYNLPKDCGTPISGFCDVNQFRASNPRVAFLENGVVQVVIPITAPTSNGTASDPYYIPFDVAVMCVK